ncbi:MAG: hypothetical protein FWG77_06070 [Treponema sp.]|nr:hypothetical protein [Treponema sp.]
MKKSLLIIIVFVISGGLFAQDWSGVSESSFNYVLSEANPEHSFGFEQFTNLRLRVRTRDSVTFNGAFNLIAMSGNYALGPIMTGLAISGENYAAAMELERLFIRIAGEHIDTEAGLLRMNFGYGQVWGSSDFLNPRNPLAINARPRGVLGINSAFYPTDTLRLMAFAAAPKNPLEFQGGGIIPGIVLDQHWWNASLQAIYAYETVGFADDSPELGLHRFGLSLKLDLVLGFVADALYVLDPDRNDGIDALSAGLGFDYSFLGGDLYVLAEYLYNGSSSISALGFGGYWMNNHYLYASAMYRFNDFFTMSLSTLMCFDDFAFQPIISADYELFQGFSLNLTARIPNSMEGTGDTRFILNTGARLRF